jgi:thiol-disulfide isomerase/thioredoxin
MMGVGLHHPRRVGVHRSRPRLIGFLFAGSVLVAACGGSGSPAASEGAPPASAAPSVVGSADVPAATILPDWYDVSLTDVRSGTAFTVGQFAGKVVLIEAMAEWCPTCLEQQAEVKRLHGLLGNRADLVSVSLDIDLHEDEASLREYAAGQGYDWYFAVAPIEVARALGNLYSAQYLNPPVSPMLLIDRDGTAVQLPYGVKTAEILQEMLDPYLGS